MLKCAIIHTPKLFLNKENEVLSSLNFCAMGLFSLAGEIIKEGFSVEIINLGLEKYLDKNFLLSDYLKENKINFAAFSLHWLSQTYDTIEVIRKIKENNDIYVTLGGYSASYFAFDILNSYPFIDSIIKGEGEKTIRELVCAIYNKKDFSKIPNLYYKKDNKIILNKEIFVPKSEDLDSYSFFIPNIMKNYEKSLKLPYILNFSKENSLENTPVIQNIPLGRGCLGNCAWCQGGFRASKITGGRDFISYRNIDNIISDIKLFKENGIHTFNFSFDPNNKDRSFLIKLLEKIEKEFMGDINCYFGIDGLMSFEFLDAFKKAFNSDSTIVLNPVFKNEALRKKYKSFFYTNKELEEALAYMDKKEINSEIYFSIFEGISENENIESKKYGKYLKEKFDFVKNYYIYESMIEPASLMYLNPLKYNIKKSKSFIDYYNETKSFDSSFENKEIFHR